VWSQVFVVVAVFKVVELMSPLVASLANSASKGAEAPNAETAPLFVTVASRPFPFKVVVLPVSSGNFVKLVVPPGTPEPPGPPGPPEPPPQPASASDAANKTENLTVTEEVIPMPLNVLPIPVVLPPIKEAKLQ
jgi:hypothetical protein